MNQVVALPFGGGNKFSFNKFKINITTMEYNRDSHSLIECLVNEIIKINGQYYLYGHSMGALLAYLVCHKLQEENLFMPEKLIVSGKKAPSIPREKKIAHLPDEEFWNEIIALGGIPNEMLNYPELIDYYLPILRYDFKFVESYQYERKTKLNIPIDVFYGSEEATMADMIGWREETTEEVIITKLSGDHFFIHDHVEYFKKYFNNLIYVN
ncbi:thioesterase II family protein [Chryseobacterium pennae]|nr:thioesterase [Chryseobacterium pennae]